ncbi:hypothetical protein, partial [Cellulomonas sp. P5_C6]
MAAAAPLTIWIVRSADAVDAVRRFEVRAACRTAGTFLLHREDAYEKESLRAGEADLIVAKHRNGPTDTLV